MTAHLWNSRLSASVLGGLYGVVLLVFAVILAGAGHSTYLPLAVFGAPFSLLGGWFAFVAIAVLWSAVGLAIGAGKGPAVPAGMLLIHAISVAAVLIWGSGFESAEARWRDLQRVRSSADGLVKVAFAFYAAGQVAAWVLVARKRAKRPVR